MKSQQGAKVAVADANGQYIDVFDVVNERRVFQFTRGI